MRGLNKAFLDMRSLSYCTSPYILSEEASVVMFPQHYRVN